MDIRVGQEAGTGAPTPMAKPNRSFGSSGSATRSMSTAYSVPFTLSLR